MGDDGEEEEASAMWRESEINLWERLTPADGPATCCR